MTSDVNNKPKQDLSINIRKKITLNLLNTTTKKWIAMFYAINIYFTQKINTNVGTVVFSEF